MSQRSSQTSRRHAVDDSSGHYRYHVAPYARMCICGQVQTMVGAERTHASSLLMSVPPMAPGIHACPPCMAPVPYPATLLIAVRLPGPRCPRRPSTSSPNPFLPCPSWRLYPPRPLPSNRIGCHPPPHVSMSPWFLMWFITHWLSPVAVHPPSPPNLALHIFPPHLVLSGGSRPRAHTAFIVLGIC